MLKKCLLSLLLFSLFTGCSRIDDPKGDYIVQNIYERTGYNVGWDRKNPCSKEDLIHGFLQSALTVEEAVQIALLNSPRIQALFEEVGLAQADLINASLIANPIASVAVRIPDGSFPSTNPEIDALQPFISILLQPIRRRVASLKLSASMAHVTSELFQFIETVSEAFYAAQAAMINLEWQKQVVEARELESLITSRLLAVGNTNQIHLDIHETEYEEARLTYEALEIEANTAKMSLAQLIGLFDFELSHHMPLPSLPNCQLEQLVAAAYEQRYDLLSMRMQTDAIAASMGLYQWYAYSDFAAGVAYEREIETTNKIGPGMTFEIPIFNFGQGDRVMVRALLCQNVQQTGDLCLQIRQEVETFYRGMVHTKTQVRKLMQTIIPDRKNQVDQTLKFYNFMNANVIELLDTKVSELMSQIMLVETKRDYLIYRARLTRSLGGILP